jgi:hypothetical protein
LRDRAILLMAILQLLIFQAVALQEPESLADLNSACKRFHTLVANDSIWKIAFDSHCKPGIIAPSSNVHLFSFSDNTVKTWLLIRYCVVI